MKNLFSVEGKTVLITGGSRGIGEMIATGFVENGAKVYITARKAQALQRTRRGLSKNVAPAARCPSASNDATGSKGRTAGLGKRVPEALRADRQRVAR